MCMPQSRQDPAHTVVVPHMWTVWIALFVGVGMVLAMIGDPGVTGPCTAIDPSTAKAYSIGFEV